MVEIVNRIIVLNCYTFPEHNTTLEELLYITRS